MLFIFPIMHSWMMTKICMQLNSTWKRFQVVQQNRNKIWLFLCLVFNNFSIIQNQTAIIELRCIRLSSLSHKNVNQTFQVSSQKQVYLQFVCMLFLENHKTYQAGVNIQLTFSLIIFKWFGTRMKMISKLELTSH